MGSFFIYINQSLYLMALAAMLPAYITPPSLESLILMAIYVLGVKSLQYLHSLSKYKMALITLNPKCNKITEII